MKYVSVSILSIFIAVCATYAKSGDSLLTATKFPKTAADLTFKQRMDVLAAGYEDFDTVFDSNGVCVKNCPYVGITLKDFEKRIEQTAAQVQQDLNEINQNADMVNPNPPTNPTAPGQINMPTPGNTPPSPPVIAPEAGNTPGTGNTPPVNPQPPIITPPPGNTPPSASNIPTTCPLRVNPVNVTSEMGPRAGGNHNGIDIGVSVGTPVYAAASGTVVISKPNGQGYGKYISIQHARNYYTVYGHLSELLVQQGQTVTAGQLIAKSGNTGNSTGPHLHFEVLKNAPLVDNGATPVDPRQITGCPWHPARRR